MACTASKVPFLRVISKRGFAASACPRPIGKTAEVNACEQDNKIVVAAAGSVLPVSRVSVVFRAGSRNESYENQGAAHLLAASAGLTTENSTGFAITRNIQQAGGKLVGTADRELVSFTVTTTSNKVETALRYLQDVIQPAFKPWELQDNIPRIKSQLADVPPQTRAIELLHKAAYRNGLGNSVYIPKFQLGKLSSESLQHFVSNNCTADRCAVVGVGVELNVLAGFAQSLDLDTSSQGKTPSANYYGGDARKDKSGNIAHVAVAGQGGAIRSQKESLAFAILARAVGAPAPTKYGNIVGSFGKALTSAVPDASVSSQTLNLNYADSGLFGFVVSTDVQHIGKAVEALTKSLKSGSVSEDDVNRGKALLKADFLEAYSTDKLLLKALTVQTALTRQALNAEEIIVAIDSITPQDVQEAAKKAGASKLSVGAIGNLANVPYASDLC